MKKQCILLFGILSMLTFAEINIYGPGGPGPAINEIVEVIKKEKNYDINLKIGFLDMWMSEAEKNGDIIISGSQYMMNNFAEKLQNIDKKTITGIKFREGGILVREGNPKNIKSVKDLGKENIKILVMDSLGQISLWEDIVGKENDIDLINKVRQNINCFSKSGAKAIKKWTEDKTIDAVIIWKPWQDRFKNSSFIELDRNNKVLRPSMISLTEQGKNNPEAVEIYKEILSNKYDEIWEKHGWYK